MNLALPARPMTDDAWTPRLATALAGSIAAHLVVLAGLALVIGIGASGRGGPFDHEPLRATLASPPSPVLFPQAPAKPDPSPLAPKVSAPATAQLPVPLRPRQSPASSVAEPFEGRVEILADDGAPVDASVEAAVITAYPRATREVVEFDKAPVARYPEAGRRERRQVFLRVPAVVREDGSLEIPPGAFDDPMFGEAIRTALATAKARLPDVNAPPQTIWTVLTFYFEHYASGESQRTKYETR